MHCSLPGSVALPIMSSRLVGCIHLQMTSIFSSPRTALKGRSLAADVRLRVFAHFGFVSSLIGMAWSPSSRA